MCSGAIHYKVTIKSAVKTVNLAKVSGLLSFVVSQKIGCLLVHPHYGRLHGCALDRSASKPASDYFIPTILKQTIDAEFLGSCSHKHT